jgi:hypothetical protein
VLLFFFSRVGSQTDIAACRPLDQPSTSARSHKDVQRWSYLSRDDARDWRAQEDTEAFSSVRLASSFEGGMVGVLLSAASACSAVSTRRRRVCSALP